MHRYVHADAAPQFFSTCLLGGESLFLPVELPNPPKDTFLNPGIVHIVAHTVFLVRSDHIEKTKLDRIHLKLMGDAVGMDFTGDGDLWTAITAHRPGGGRVRIIGSPRIEHLFGLVQYEHLAGLGPDGIRTRARISAGVQVGCDMLGDERAVIPHSAGYRQNAFMSTARGAEDFPTIQAQLYRFECSH